MKNTQEALHGLKAGKDEKRRMIAVLQREAQKQADNAVGPENMLHARHMPNCGAGAFHSVF